MGYLNNIRRYLIYEREKFDNPQDKIRENITFVMLRLIDVRLNFTNIAGPLMLDFG